MDPLAASDEQKQRDEASANAPEADRGSEWRSLPDRDSRDVTINFERLHPAWIVLRAAVVLRAMAVPLILFLVAGRDDWGWTGYAVVMLFVVGTIIQRALFWWRFRYAVTDRGLQVQSGLLQRQERLLPLERIQAVDFNETVLHRVFRVVEVKIESAAGGSKEADIVLGAVGRADAARLRERLLRRPSREAPAPAVDVRQPTTEEAPPLLVLSWWDLIVAGATSARVGPALAALVAVAELADDIFGDAWERVARSLPEPTLPTIMGLAIAMMVGAWLLAIGSMVITFAGFELRRDGDRLHIQHGLFERRRSSIPLARVQAVTISEGLLRQLFGLAAVRVESAGYGVDTAVSGVLAPLVRLKDLHALLTAATPDYAVDLAAIRLNPAPDRARRRYALGNVWPLLGGVVVLTALASLLPRIAWWWGVVPLAALPLVVALGLIQHRDAGWWMDDRGHVVVRWRTFARVTTLTLRRRINYRGVSQNPLQRRAALATFFAAVASGGEGGRFALHHLDAGAAFDLLDRLAPPRVVPGTTGVAALTTVSSGDHDSGLEGPAAGDATA